MNTEIFNEGYLCAWQEHKSGDKGWGKYHYEFYHCKKDCADRKKALSELPRVSLRENAPTSAFPMDAHLMHPIKEEPLELRKYKIEDTKAPSLFEESHERDQESLLDKLEASRVAAAERHAPPKPKPEAQLSAVLELLNAPHAREFFPAGRIAKARVALGNADIPITKESTIALLSKNVCSIDIAAALAKRIDWRALHGVFCDTCDYENRHEVRNFPATYFTQLCFFLKNMTNQCA